MLLLVNMSTKLTHTTSQTIHLSNNIQKDHYRELHHHRKRQSGRDLRWLDIHGHLLIIQIMNVMFVNAAVIIVQVLLTGVFLLVIVSMIKLWVLLNTGVGTGTYEYRFRSLVNNFELIDKFGCIL